MLVEDEKIIQEKNAQPIENQLRKLKKLSPIDCGDRICEHGTLTY